MKGYTLDDKLKKFDDAKTVYEFPFCRNIQIMILQMIPSFYWKTWGKTEEEIIKLFESKAAESTSQE